MLRGWIDKIEGEIAGWAFDDNNPMQSISLDIYRRGIFSKILADKPRSDLQFLGAGQINYGFYISTPPTVRSDEIVFGRYIDEYIIQSSTARQSHLVNCVYHPIIIENIDKRSIIYSGASTTTDLDLLERICQAAARAEKKSADEYGPLWGMIVASRHAEFVRILEAGGGQKLGDYLSELGRQPLAFGFFEGPDAHTAAESSILFRNAAATAIFDRILSLAEALGCIYVENPEQGGWGQVIDADPDDLIDRIAEALRISNLQPPIGGFWGLPTRFGAVNKRMLDALYAASRISTIHKTFNLDGVTEIGGGAGFAAHYSLIMGVAPYKIIDLPTMGAVQAYTLRNHKGLKLYGEELRDARIELAPTFDFAASPNRKYDLLFNMDSLPEIETNAAIAYLNDARKNGYRYLLSINQESGANVDQWSQSKVKSLVQRAGGYTLINRHRDWMRPGYVEELYAISPI